MKTLLSFLMIFTFISCSENEKKEEEYSIAQDPEAVALVEQLENIQLQRREGRVFRALTVQDLRRVEQSLELMKVALIRLGSNPNDREALQMLYTHWLEFRDVNYDQRDEAFIQTFVEDAGKKMQQIARLQGVELKDLSWTLYETRFSSGLGNQITTFPENSPWSSGWSLNKPWARVSTRFRSRKSWLVFPPMNLAGVESPTFRVHHATWVEADDRRNDPLNLGLIYRDAFKVMASIDYNYGDPDLATWIELPLTGYPAGVDFHSLWSDPVDLTDVAVENVTLALVFDYNRDVLGSASVGWQLSQVQINGRSDHDIEMPRGMEPPPAEPYYVYEFSDGLDGFTQTTVEGDPASFIIKDGVANASGFPNKSTGIVRLETPTLNLDTSFNSCLIVDHAVGFFMPAAISRGFIKVSVRLASGGDWTELNFEKYPDENSRNNFITSECLELPESVQKQDIVLGFSYQSEDNEDNDLDLFPNWNIKYFSFTEVQ